MAGEQKRTSYPNEEMARLVRSRDWSDTPLGPIAQWSETFSSLVVNMLKPPPILEKENLVELIQWLAEQMSNYNLDITVKDDGQPKPVSEENHIILYENVRELCFNVIKHAGVSKATITLERADDQVHIIVEDNGKGFNVRKKQKQFEIEGGYGLFNINERMKRLEGSMKVESQPGKGTKVLLSAPVNE